MLLAEATTTNYHDFGGVQSSIAAHSAYDASNSIGDSEAQIISKSDPSRGMAKPFSKHLDSAVEHGDSDAAKIAKGDRSKIEQGEENRAKQNAKKSSIRAEMLVTLLDVENKSANGGSKATQLLDGDRAAGMKTRKVSPGDVSNLPAGESDLIIANRSRSTELLRADESSLPKQNKSGQAEKNLSGGLPDKTDGSTATNHSKMSDHTTVNTEMDTSADGDSGPAAIRNSEESGLSPFARLNGIVPRDAEASVEASADGFSPNSDGTTSRGNRIVTSVIDLVDRGSSTANTDGETGAEAKGGGTSTVGEMGAGQGENASRGETDGSELQARGLRFLASEAISDGKESDSGRTGTFNRMFRERMQPEIVRQSTIVLKGNNRGEIHMTLRPENLGSVRMRLSLDQNRVSGRIIVESSVVKTLLDQNLESLSRSFREDGFDAASFEVTVSGGDQNHNSDNQQQEVAHDGSTHEHASQKMDETASLVEATSDTTINLVV